jgi:PAS domain S-box-containing protein
MRFPALLIKNRRATKIEFRWYGNKMAKSANTFDKAILDPALQHERIFRTMVESVRDYAIFVLDPSGIVATWNPGAHRIKQYEAQEIIGKHFSAFYPETDIRNGKPEMELRVASEVGRFEDEGWRLRKDGTRFWANVIITAIRDEHGTLLGFGKITRDLTERIAAEQRYRMLVEGVTDYSIFSLDATGVVTSWNLGAERIKQYSAQEIIGKHFSTFYTPEDVEARMPEMVLRTAEQEGHWEGEGWRMRKDGTRFWSSIVVSAIKDEEGRLTGFSKVTRDITDRKKLMDELQRHMEELEVQVAERERTNAELEAFSYSVSHDLRAPLRAIEGFASALREDYGDKLDGDAQDYLNEIITAATRLNRLVQDLLNYGRVGRTELPLTQVVLKPVIEKIVSENVKDNPEGNPGNKGQITIKGQPSQKVLAHEATLYQILSNLVSNALKFRRNDVEPQVEIAITATKNNMTRVSVIDNGIGIAPQHRERIFKVFERLHGIEEYPGTGIGLAIVKRAVERMGGRCGVESILGKGSTFWVELPQPAGADR